MDEAAAGEFVDRFAAYWRAPSAGGLREVLAEDVRLRAPMTPATAGLGAAEEVFSRLLALVPDLRGEVHRWGPTSDGVLIEFTLSGTAGGAPISWRAVDRFVLAEDGRAAERVSYFDSMPLVLALARRPRAWAGFARARLRRPPGRG